MMSKQRIRLCHGQVFRQLWRWADSCSTSAVAPAVLAPLAPASGRRHHTVDRGDVRAAVTGGPPDRATAIPPAQALVDLLPRIPTGPRIVRPASRRTRRLPPSVASSMASFGTVGFGQGPVTTVTAGGRAIGTVRRWSTRRRQPAPCPTIFDGHNAPPSPSPSPRSSSSPERIRRDVGGVEALVAVDDPQLTDLLAARRP